MKVSTFNQRRFDPANPAQHFYDHALRFEELFARLVLPLREHRTHRLEADLADQGGRGELDGRQRLAAGRRGLRSREAALRRLERHRMGAAVRRLTAQVSDPERV